VLAVTVGTLDVAARSHGQMNATILVKIAAEAGMSVKNFCSIGLTHGAPTKKG